MEQTVSVHQAIHNFINHQEFRILKLFKNKIQIYCSNKLLIEPSTQNDAKDFMSVHVRASVCV